MNLKEAPDTVCKVVKFPASVTSYLRSEDGQNEQYYGLKGGLLKDTQYAWLSWGPNFEVVRTNNGAKVAAWTFGAVLHDARTRVTCVTELPCSDGSGRVSQFVVGLECELVGGMICVFDIRGSKVLRAVQMPSKVMSVSVVDCASEGCYPLPQLLSSMTGVLAVGLAGGQIMLVDLCRINCDDGLNMGACGDLRDELHACQLLPISVHETDQEALEYKRAHAARTGDHLCVVLNESFLADKMFLLPLPDGNMFSVLRRRVDVTAVMYIPRIASIVAGFSFGSFQIWNLMQLTLEYMSPTMQDPLPVISFGFQEPCDDPRNFCYLWAVHSSVSHRNRLPFAVMYALCYQSKEWVDGYGYLYQDFISCVHRFDFDLDEDESGVTVVGGRIAACHTINKLPRAVSRRDNPRAELDESVQENDLTLCLFVWETWGTNCPGSTHMAVFDLNQWYKEQMPGKIVKGQASTYIAVFSLDEVAEASASSANSTNPLLDVKVDPASISQFTAVQSLEEHFYPSALAFESLSLLGEELVVVGHPGVQRDILLQLELSGPSALMYPTKLFHHCIAIGLRPVYVEVSSTFNCPLTEQREFLLSVALEYQLVGFLSRCAAEWMDGSQSAVGCTLPALLKWGWQRAASLKSRADNLCITLYDYSGVKLDSNSYQLLDYCGNQLHHLTTLFQGVLKMCKNSTVQGVGDVSQQAQVLELVAVYIEVVEWFVNVGLLPEFPCEDLTLVDDDYEAAGECGPHRVPYPAATLAKMYQKRRAELEKLSISATDKMDILFIDGLVKRECNGDRLSSLWERDGGTGLYPPPSIQSLLRTYLLDGIPMHVKHCIVIYVFLDLAGMLESRRYTATINQFIKFPSAFRLTPSFIKITQALWLLDHQDYTEAIDMLLDPLVSMDDLKPWQHQCIIQAFLYQHQHQMALKYIRMQQPPLKDIEDIRLHLTVLLVNGLIHEAFQYQRQHCNEQNSRDLLQHFFSACQQMNQLGVVLQFALSPVEEEAFTYFLQNCQNPRADDMHVMYFLERSRIAEAMEVNNSIRSSKSHIDSNILKQGHTEDKSSSVRDTIVQAYANTLPSVTRKLALYCAQEKLCFMNWKQVSQPTPMSVDVHRGELQPVRYRSSLIRATLEKARETWSHVIQPPAPPCTPAKRDWSSMEKPSVEMTPFLCTPRAASETFSFNRDVPAVVFPTLTHPTSKSDDEIMGGSPVKRFRYSDHYSSPLGSAIASSRKRLNRYSNVDALSLLQTPHVRRRTPLSVSRLQEQQDLPASSTSIFTPHSILKVRKMVRWSASPDTLSQVSVPSFTGSSTTPELLEEEEQVAQEKMQVSDEEIQLGRQIRFSLPSDEQQDEKSTSEDILLHPVLRCASRKSILGVTPRKALSHIRRHGCVRFDSSVSDKKGDSSEMLEVTGSKTGLAGVDLISVVSTLPNCVMNEHKSEPLHAADSSLERCQSTEGTREASQINEPDMQDTPESEVCLLDNESTNMENDSDVFHSLENSAATTDSISNSVVDSADVSSESPLKKQRVCSPDKKSEEVTSIQVDCLEVKEEVTSDLRTWKTESNLQNCITVQEARVADTVEARHVVEEEDSTVVAVVQKMHEKNFKPVDTAEVDVEITEESVTVTVAGGKCKNKSQSNTEDVLEEEKRDVGILLDTTTYTGSSFEISKDMEQEEEVATDGMTYGSSDGDISVFSVTEESDVGPFNIPESEAKKMPTLVIKSIVGNAESFASCEEDPKEYQTLQSLITESEQALEEKEDSGNEIDDDDILFVSGERPVLLAAQNKEHETTTDSSKEESEPEEDVIVRLRLHATEIEHEVDVEEEEVIEDEEEVDEEGIEDEDLADEGEDLDEEEEFESQIQYLKEAMSRKLPRDDGGCIVILDSDTEEEKIEPSKQSAVGGKHKAGDFSNTDGSDGEDEEGVMEEEEEEEEEEDDYETSSKFDSKEEESEDSEETSSKFDSNEGEEEENEEIMSKFDSGSEIDHVLDEGAVEPKVNVEVSTSDDDIIIEEDSPYENPTQVLTVSVGDVLKDSGPAVKDIVGKEPMDFETCITANEISKYGQRQISEVIGIDFPCKEDNAGSKIPVMSYHVMDFEEELTASQISKAKQTEERNERNTQISVENHVKLSELKQEDITVPETPEMLVGDGKQGGEECDLVVVVKKEQIAVEKFTQRDGDIVHLLHTEGIPKFLQQDGVDAMDNPAKENDVLSDMTVISGASNATAQQVIGEVNATRCGIKARKTSESSCPFLEKLQSSSDLEERSQDVKTQKTSSMASSLQREDDYIDVNTETQMDADEVRVSKQMDRAGSLQRDNGVTDKEACGMKAYESRSIGASTQLCTGAGSADSHERKLHASSSTADSVQQEEILSDEIESRGRKVCKPGSRASSVKCEDVPSDESEAHKRKVRKTSSRASSVQHEVVPSDETEAHEKKVAKSSSRASSVQRDDVPLDEIDTYDRKLQKLSSRASSVQCEDAPLAGTEFCKRKVCKPSSRASSVQHEEVPSYEAETCDRKIRKPSSRASSVQHEGVPSDEAETCDRRVRKPSSRASSVQRDVPSDETETYDRRVHKSNSRASSVQREDVPPDGTESSKRKARKPSSRAGSVQREDVPTYEIERCVKQAHKSNSKACSVQLGDVPSDEAETHERRVCKPSSTVSSVQHEDSPSAGNERKVRKRSSRAGSIQNQDVPSDKIELCNRKICTASRSDCVPHEDVPTDEMESGARKIYKPGSITGSGQCEYVPVGGTDDNGRKISSECSGEQQVVPSSETESLEKRHSKPKRGAGSVQKDCLEVIEEEESYISEADKIDSGINSVQSAGIPSDKADCSKCKIDEPKESGSVKCVDVIEAGFLDRPNSTASCVDYKDVTLASDFTFNENRWPRTSSVNSEASTLIWEESRHLVRCKKKCGTRSRHSSASTVSSSVQGDEGMDIEEVKIYSTRSQKCSIPLNIVSEGPKDISGTPLSAIHDADISVQTDDKERKIKARCRAVSGHLLEDQSISGPSSTTNEMFRFTGNITGQLCRKAQSESGCVVGPVTRSKKFTRSVVGISTKTTTTDVESVTDNSASTKMSLRSRHDRMRCSHEILGSVHGDDSCSERSSGSVVQWKRKGDSTKREDSLISQQVLEEYATNRRLTRLQRSLLERSFELAKPSLFQLTRHRKLPSLPETSGDEEDKPGEEDESSSQISSVGMGLSHTRSCPTFHERTSPTSQIPLHKAGKQTRCSQKALSRHNDSTPTNSTSSVMSDALAQYGSSATSALSQLGASPLSTVSEDVTLERTRRKSFKRAQIALRSASEHGSVSGVPSGRKSVANSQGDSDSKAGSSYPSLTSTGSHITRSVAMRLGRGYTSEEVRHSPRFARLQEEDVHSASPSTSFHFSPPTVVLGSVRKEESTSGTPSSPVPAFVFSPPQKQHLLPKQHCQSVASQRAHAMALRGLHTIIEEPTPPSTSTNTTPPQTSERETTPITVKKSKKFKPTPSSKTSLRSSRRHMMTPLTNQEQRELEKRNRSSHRSVSTEPHRHYTAFKHRKLFKIRRSSRLNL